jgi:hypothetical protein
MGAILVAAKPKISPTPRQMATTIAETPSVIKYAVITDPMERTVRCSNESARLEFQVVCAKYIRQGEPCSDGAFLVPLLA